MTIKVLYSKIKEAWVTLANPNYSKGSITIDKDIMDQAGLVDYQVVDVNCKSKKVRITTYVIPATRGSGRIELNGGASQYFNKGDIVHINAYADMEFYEAKKWVPIII